MTDPHSLVGTECVTDYPFRALGDDPADPAPMRRCRVLSYDGDKYCEVEIEGKALEVKAAYLTPVIQTETAE